jgi:hypothetical protein
MRYALCALRQSIRNLTSQIPHLLAPCALCLFSRLSQFGRFSLLTIDTKEFRVPRSDFRIEILVSPDLSSRLTLCPMPYAHMAQYMLKISIVIGTL